MIRQFWSWMGRFRRSQEMKLALTLSLLCFGIGLANADTPAYQRNTDYSKPRGTDTFLYGVFSLDCAEWPHRTQVGVSSFGFVYVMEWVEGDRYHFTPFLTPPHEVAEFNKVLHKVIPSMVTSRQKTRDEVELLRSIIGYSQPSLSAHSVSCYSDAQESAARLLKLLRAWQTKAKTYRKAHLQPGKGEKTIAILETKDSEFLQHMMNTLHNVHTWKAKKQREQDGADQPATAPESKPKGNQKPQQESEGRSR